MLDLIKPFRLLFDVSAMPLFYFNVYDGRSVLDTDGVELADAVNVYEEAIRLSGEAIAREASRIAIGRSWNMEVTDQTGKPVVRIDFSLTTA